MIKKYIFFVLAVIMLCVAGCGNKSENMEQINTKNIIVNSSEDFATVSESEDVFNLPDIVFINTITYEQTSEEEEPKVALTFYDKSGNHYVSTDEYVCSLNFEQLIQEYAKGDISDKISFHTSCDRNELIENYNKLCKLNRDGFEIVHPEFGPEVLANYEVWYGLCYNQSGNVQSVILHERNEHGEHYADNDQVNEIYEWYIGTFSND